MTDATSNSGARRLPAWQTIYLPPGALLPPTGLDAVTEPAADALVGSSAVSSMVETALVDLFPEPPRRKRPPRLHLAWCVVGMAGCMSLSAPRTTFMPVGPVYVSGTATPGRFTTSSHPRSATSETNAADSGSSAANPSDSIAPDSDLGDPVAITPIPRTDRQETSGRRSATAPEAPRIPDDEPISGPSAPVQSRTVPDAFGPSPDGNVATPPALTVPEAAPAEPVPGDTAAPEANSNEAKPAGSIPSELAAPRPLVELAVVDPSSHQVGAGATFRVSLTNRSTTALEGVRVVCEFANEMQFGTAAEKFVSQPLGVWAARETKDLALTLHSATPGTFAATFRIERESDGEVLAERRGNATFVDRRYELAVIGPVERTIGSRAEFTVRIANASAEALPPTELILKRDATLVLKELTEGSRRSGGEIRWSVPELAPGAETQFQAEFECRTAADRATVTARLSSPTGGSTDMPEEESEATVRILPVTGVLDVRLADVTDPIAVGEETVYRLTITNLGLQEARRIRIRCEATSQVELSTVTVLRGKEPLTTQFVTEGSALVGDEIDSLPADATLTIEVKSTARSPGRGEVTASVEHEVPNSLIEVREPTWITP